MSRINVTLECLEDLFPFTFVIDGNWNVLHVGKSLKKISKDTFVGSNLRDHFNFVKPTEIPNILEFNALKGELVILNELKSNARLMGQIIKPSLAPIYVFIGSLAVVDAEELNRLGLDFSDFPVQDQIFDFLMLSQTQLKTIREAEILKDKLIEANRLAKKASDLKSQFLANMSHELRTPMNGVLGMASILVEATTLAPDQLEYVQNIIQSGESMLALINDILDLSKVESGYIHLDSENLDLTEILEEIKQTLQVAVDKQNNQLTFHVEPNIAKNLQGDRLRLRQILLNLIANANKFTNSGSIKTHIQVFEPDPSKIQFIVSDTGIGMSHEVLSRIFSPFVQGDSSMTKKYGGTGLGLSICKKLVEAMGGEIEVFSTVGVGSTFWFTADLNQERVASRKLNIKANE